MQYRRVAQLRTVEELRTYIDSLGIHLEFDPDVQSGPSSPLAQPTHVHNLRIGNRFAILPMEGWDAAPDGQPTDLVKRRWERFGQSGAKLIWGCEAVAVRHDGRANPNQLVINTDTAENIAVLRSALVNTHKEHYGGTDDLVVGLQLTHSGRFARPNDKYQLESKILYHHPLLDDKYKLPSHTPLLTDDEIAALIEDFVKAAVLAQQAGFQFVDIKHCHGYLGHEFLSARQRDGRYGGSFENRTRFLREIVAGIRDKAPGLHIGVRLSAFDLIPFRPNLNGIGEAETWNVGSYDYTFGGDSTGTGIDLTEPRAFLDLLLALDVRMVCITGGSPYYNPHIQRPALFPPSDGYLPPEDPLAGVARQIDVVAQLKQHRPELLFVGSGYSYLQDWLPNVAQYEVRRQHTDLVGIGRMVLTYPDMVHDVLTGNLLQRKRICRTFSDCTTAPRHGMVSGCYPLDNFYKARPEAKALTQLKKEQKISSPDADVETLSTE
ncbi:MAG: NADH:flavin oxidoreductase [Anaerolineae bacterium]|nr:NADH:flavin oxidoreductase [Anaerolineae bacterium]